MGTCPQHEQPAKLQTPRSDFGAPRQNRNCKSQVVGPQQHLYSPETRTAGFFHAMCLGSFQPSLEQMGKEPCPRWRGTRWAICSAAGGGTLALVC